MGQALATQFGDQELALVASALEVAEESVGDYYRLSDATWLRYPYEVKTLAELMPAEVTSRALAQVLRLRRPPAGGRLRARDFYRICLQDHNLLGLIAREGTQELLLPLLIYVLAHELVHVVRFYRFQHLFEADEEERAAEEARVHRITAQALGRVRLARLDEVLKFYEQHGCDTYVAGCA